MKTFTVLVAGLASLASYASAAATKPDIDTTILQYALTLEHLENAFYAGAIAKFSAHDFQKAGYPSYIRKRFAQIASHEKTHVSLLQSALGKAATKPCKYDFGYKTIPEFMAISRVLEGVGVSAYLGAAKSITNGDYLTVAGAILTVEARHQSFVASTAGGGPFPSAFDTPLDFSQVYSLAAPFIKSCPQTNPALPVSLFPTLTVKTAKPAPGKSILLVLGPKAKTAPKMYCAFINELTTKFAPYVHGACVMPKTVTGTVYIVVTNSDALITDDTTIAGPALVILADPAPMTKRSDICEC